MAGGIRGVAGGIRGVPGGIRGVFWGPLEYRQDKMAVFEGSFYNPLNTAISSIEYQVKDTKNTESSKIIRYSDNFDLPLTLTTFYGPLEEILRLTLIFNFGFGYNFCHSPVHTFSL